MSKGDQPDRSVIEERVGEVFADLGFVRAYARRRGAEGADALAAEVMAVAWRRLSDVPSGDARPWLVATARNLLLAERRLRGIAPGTLEGVDVPAPEELPPPTLELDAELEAALICLSERDREALLLVAWEDLTPSLAAASVGISAAAFRVRLHRARRRLIEELRARERARAGASGRVHLERA